MSSSSGGSSSGNPCPPLTLGGATEDIYVDKGVPVTGNGTLTCPFATILEASSLAAPGNAVTQRTIHVRGYAGGTLAATYAEAAPIILSPRVRLTSNYDAGNTGGVTLVRIVASGSCLSITGAAANCAVGMENNSVMELVTVTTRGGAAQTHAIATTNAATPPGGAPPTIRNVNAEGATANGILVSSSALLGPGVNATGNAFNGLLVQIGNLGPAIGRPSVTILDVTSGALTPSNHFSNNTRNGAAFFGDVAIQVDGLLADGNSNNGLIIATPLFANIAGQPTHTLANVISTNNSNHGLRLNSGDVLLQVGTLTNAFNNNGGHGIDSSVGDSLGNARLVTQPSTSITGAYLIAHQANSNRLGGVHLNQVTPLGYGPHVLESLEALRNGVAAGSVALASGVFVEVTGANQPSVTLRGNTLMGNAGAGVRFQKAQNNALDIGTFTGIVQDGGENVFAAPGGGANAKSALCLENLTLGDVTQEVEENRWVTLPCPFPMLPPVNPAFIAQLNGICGSNAAYVDITYVTVPTTTVTFSAQTCF